MDDESYGDHVRVDKRPPRARSFSQWITDPQTIIALSAVLLSVCGLFIALYEASLIRRQQRAAVWPHVEVGASIQRGNRVALLVQNTGVGPARIGAAAVTYEGETKDNWEALIRSLGQDPDSVNIYRSLINGRVLPAGSQERIFSVSEGQGPTALDLMRTLEREIGEGTLDATVCYCSVYDECWTSTLQDMMGRFRGEVTPGAREVESCEVMERSGI